MVFQKCDFTETGAPEPACLQFIAENVKPNSLPVQLNKNLILIYFSKADYYFLIVNGCVKPNSGTMFCHKRHESMIIKGLIWIKSARSEWQTRLIIISPVKTSNLSDNCPMTDCYLQPCPCNFYSLYFVTAVSDNTQHALSKNILGFWVFLRHQSNHHHSIQSMLAKSNMSLLDSVQIENLRQNL